jgi:pimeloyl-ACP methyl ester carboxylesterase
MRTTILLLFITGVLLSILYAVGLFLTERVESVDWRDVTPLPGAKFITTKGGRIHYVDMGEGPPILLMHGSGAGLADWQEGAIELLSKNHRVIALDYFGNGFSERNSDFTYGYDLWVEQAVALLDALHIDHVTVIGHSVGGAMACILATDHPERVDHVVTIGTGLTIEPQQFLLIIPGVGEIMLANASLFGEPHSPQHRAALEAAYQVKGTRAALLSYSRRQVFVDGWRLIWGTFEEVKAPVLHLSGTRDTHIPHNVARELAKRTRGRFVAVEGAGHNVHIEAPDRLAEEVARFLSETSVKEAR